MKKVITQALETFKDIRAKGATNAELALFLMKWIDDITDKTFLTYPIKVSCKKGCSHCCYQLVGTTSHEVDLILECVDFDEADKAKILRLAKYKTVKGWNALDHKDKRCIFLSDNEECRIYPFRPVACRAYFVVSNPEFCEPNKKSKVPIIDNPNINGVYAAFVSLFGHTGKLNELLAEKLRKQESNPSDNSDVQ